MTRIGTLNEWFRFLDARSDDEAASVVRRHMARLDDVYGDLQWVLKSLAGSPSGEVDEALRVGRTALGEAIELLDAVAARFCAGERDAS